MYGSLIGRPKDFSFLLDEEYRIVYASGWLGYTPEELVEIPISRLHPDEFAAEAFDVYNRIPQKGTSGHSLPYRAKDGTIVSADTRIASSSIDGTHLLIGIVHLEGNQHHTDEKLSAFFNLNPSACSIISIDNNEFIDVNVAFCKLLGYSRAEIIGRKAEDVGMVSVDDWNLLSASVSTEGRVTDVEVSLIALNGESKRVVVYSDLIPLHNRICRFTVFHDVSERIAIETALTSKTNELDLIFENMINAFVIWESVFDENGNYVSFRFGRFNKAYSEIAKLKYEDVAGRDVFDVWPTTEREWVEKYGSVATTGIPLSFELYHDPTNGWYHCHAYRPMDSNSQVCVIFEDITERKKNEAKLLEHQKKLEEQNNDYLAINEVLKSRNDEFRVLNKELLSAKEKAEESELKLQQIANNLIEGMLYQIISYEDGSRKFTFVNQTAEKFYGHSPEEIMEDANLVYSRIHPDDLAKLVQDEEIAIASMSVLRTEIRMFNPDGSTRWSYIVSSPRKHKGQMYWDGLEYDITERKTAEEELRIAKEQAEESDRLKSAFLANVSHEIRTPMNGILGFASLLSDPGITNEEQEEYLQIIQKSGKRMINLINDIVIISRIESGQENANLQEVEIRKCLDGIYQIYAPYAEESGVNLALQCDEEYNPTVLTDQEKLISIISNLINNSLKFTKEGEISFGFAKAGDSLEFFVKDSGCGIAEEQSKKIFDRFVQGSDELTRNYEGAGLGLAIAKAYVELIGGAIRVDSQLGVGTAFYFTIPLEYKPATQDKKKAEGQLKQSETGLKIVIADDDSTARDYLRIIVSKVSREIFTVQTGNEAVEFLRSNPDTDLILMDIKMPGIDGYEATKLIRKTNKNVVIIAQTAYALAGDKEKALEAGCNDYIAKPVSKNDLMTMIKRYFSKSN